MRTKPKERFSSFYDKAAYVLNTARGVPIEFDLRPYRETVARIRAVSFSDIDTASLSRTADTLRGRAAEETDQDSVLEEGFALIAEAFRRALGIDPFDEQLIAGIAMRQGKLAQMQTGEGKTVAAVFPACLRALYGGRTHVFTANDYLAHRDAEWMRPVYEFLGISVASITSGMERAERKRAYKADVVYLTVREAGFDYLRDGLCYEAEEVVHVGFPFAIVDEADFVLIDEARIPLVIAGSDERDDTDPARAEEAAKLLRPGEDYALDREGRKVSITLAGHRRIEDALGIQGIHEELGAAWFARIYAALHARELLSRNVDYVVKNDRVEPVDEFTGRIAARRQWPWGVQAALEAKEGVPIRREGRVYASITTGHFLGLYSGIAAMTATAVPSASEFAESYGLSIAIVPTVKPSKRIDEPDLVFATRNEKIEALVREISIAHERERPVLVGTASVKESQELAQRLAADGVVCEVLNAWNDEREAELIARAGNLGAVTISTNMAGRGTDIKLQGGAAELGGLYVIGAGRHESRRVDDQLRGRAGRQGDPGSSRFFVSLEDALFQRFGDRVHIPWAGDASDTRLRREIDHVQAILEGRNHQIRRMLQKYTRFMELDRRYLRELRDAALVDRKLPSGIEAALAGNGERGETVDKETRDAAIELFLCKLDAFWSGHLLFVEDLKEGISLVRYEGKDPEQEFIRNVGNAFESGINELIGAIAAACFRARSEPDALKIEGREVPRPSSTWTYQVNDELPGPVGGLLLSPDIGLSISAGIFVALSRIAAGIACVISVVRRIVGRNRGGKA